MVTSENNHECVKKIQIVQNLHSNPKAILFMNFLNFFSLKKHHDLMICSEDSGLSFLIVAKLLLPLLFDVFIDFRERRRGRKGEGGGRH